MDIFGQLNLNINDFKNNEEFDVSDLLSALENDEHVNLINLTPDKIKQYRSNAIKQLQLPHNEEVKMISVLLDYMYVDEIPDIKYGSFIRWVPLKNPDNLKLTRGGIVCDIVICETGTIIRCKNFKNNFFRVKMDEAMIFKKLTDQEKVILAALNYVS